jgi:serine/threonine protein phosphatase 1
MRHLAIGDIHGCSRALHTLAAWVPFRDEDVLITLGDYVDRGPDSFGVLDWLIARHRRGGLIPLAGNHEIMMLAAREDAEALDRWVAVGGDATLASYSHFDDAGRLSDIPDSHWDFLATQLLAYHEIDTHFFVHAGAWPELPLADQPDLLLYWESFNAPAPHCSGKVMVCGHTIQRSGQPRNVGHAVCIDTNVARGGWLTCLDVATGRYWQANQRGETRRGWLEEVS